jgi:hypothetical protein
LIESEQIKQIPISGRNWASLMLLTPGAINYGDGAQRAIRFSGHSLDDSNFTFDGIGAAACRNRRRKLRIGGRNELVRRRHEWRRFC